MTANLVPSGDFAGPQKEGSRFEAHRVEARTFARVLDEVATTFRNGGLPHLFMGGIASTGQGRLRQTKDVDVFVKPKHADQALELLARAGFETEETNPDWLYKALKDSVMVDLIFRSSGPIELDDEMVSRARQVDFRGLSLPVVGPEDLVVIKAIAFAEETPQHWFDALGLIGANGLDWDYPLTRARVRPLRVLSLLAYGLERGLPVPAGIVTRGLSDALPDHAETAAVEADHHLAAQVRERLAGEELEVASQGGRVVVRGSVPNRQRRDAAARAVDELLGAGGWVDQVQVEEYPAAQHSEKLP